MSQQASNQIAVVTGASRGLGLVVSRMLAAAGHPVAMIARSQAELDVAAAEIRREGGTAIAVAADVSRPDSVEALRDDVTARLGSPLILVNAVGTFGPISLIKDGNPDDWIRTIEVDLIAHYLTCRVFVGGMIESGWGRIVNFTSAASLHPPGPLNSAYATAKAGVNQFTRHLAAELDGSGVTANVLHPGDVRTAMWADIRDRLEGLGPEAAGYRRWVEWVDATGGDPPGKAAEAVLRLISDPDTNGSFVWVEDPLQAPIPSWETAHDGRPWES